MNRQVKSLLHSSRYDSTERVTFVKVLRCASTADAAPTSGDLDKAPFYAPVFASSYGNNEEKKWGEGAATDALRHNLTLHKIMPFLHPILSPRQLTDTLAPVAALTLLGSAERRRGLFLVSSSAFPQTCAKIISCKAHNLLTTTKALCYPSIMPPKSHPYEIEYRGKIIRCRSLEEMKAALAELEGSNIVRTETPWTAEEFQKFTGRIHIPQRRLLARLLESGPTEWVTDATLRDVLGLPDNNSLSGSLSGISKVARMFDIDPRRVYAQNAIYTHGQAQRTYQITAEFQKAANRHKWPSKEDLRDKF